MATDYSDRVTLDIKQQIAFVRFNRPEKHNALDYRSFMALISVQKQIKKNKSIRVVIISGAGEDFCSGLDIKSVLSNKLTAIKLLWKWLPGNANLAQRVTVGWRKLKVPVIVAIHGRCWGGGMQIALGADFRISHPNANFSIMESKWGLIPDMGGTLSLRDNMSKDQAMRLAMTAEQIDAPQALNFQLVTEIHESPQQQALVLAEQIKERSPDVIKAIKKLYHKRWQDFDRYMLAGETVAQWKILTRKNQSISVKRQMGKDIPYEN